MPSSVTRRLKTICPIFRKSSQNSCRTKTNAKISTPKVNLIVQNIYIKPLLEPFEIQQTMFLNILMNVKILKIGQEKSSPIVGHFWVTSMCIVRWDGYSALITFLVGRHASAVSLTLAHVIFAQLACPLIDIIFCPHQE